MRWISERNDEKCRPFFLCMWTLAYIFKPTPSGDNNNNNNNNISSVICLTARPLRPLASQIHLALLFRGNWIFVAIVVVVVVVRVIFFRSIHDVTPGGLWGGFLSVTTRNAGLFFFVCELWPTFSSQHLQTIIIIIIIIIFRVSPRSSPLRPLNSLPHLLPNTHRG